MTPFAPPAQNRSAPLAAPDRDPDSPRIAVTFSARTSATAHGHSPPLSLLIHGGLSIFALPVGGLQ